MAKPSMDSAGHLSILQSFGSGQHECVLSEVDARLLRGLQSGIEQAYEDLLSAYEQSVYSLVFRLLGNQNDASDVVQEVFLKVFRSVHSFREQSSLRTWIYRIAVNEAHNHRRWFSRHCRMQVPLESPHESDRESALSKQHDPGPSPYDQLLDSETHHLIEQALTRVNPLYRTAVVLRDVQSLSYEEISDILQISLGTVKSRILRGREALRKELERKMNSHLAEAIA